MGNGQGAMEGDRTGRNPQERKTTVSCNSIDLVVITHSVLSFCFLWADIKSCLNIPVRSQWSKLD